MAHLTINYKSSALNMPIRLDVLIPQGRGNYKVLYLLHGAGGDHSSWVLNTRIADYVDTTDIAVVMLNPNTRFIASSFFLCTVQNIDIIMLLIRQKVYTITLVLIFSF